MRRRSPSSSSTPRRTSSIPTARWALCEKYVTPELEARTLEVCEEAVRLRWASITEIYREHVLNEAGILPPGVAA